MVKDLNLLSLVFLNFFRDPDALPSSNYLVIQTPGDPHYANGGSSQINSPTGQPPPFGPSGVSHSKGGSTTTTGSVVSFAFAT